VPHAVRPAGLRLHQRDELVADVDERGAPLAAAQRQVEELPVELERGVDVADLERDVVDPDEAWPRYDAFTSFRWAWS
jgi:hypothetical protein